MIIVLLIFNTKVIAKFYEKLEKIKVSFTIAEPIFKVEQIQETINIKNFNKENQKEYIFKIKNFETESENKKRISKVSFEIIIEILNSNSNFPVNYKLYADNEEIILKENKSETIFIEKDIEFEKTYKLVVFYQEKLNVKKTNNESNIEILIKSNQVLS